MNAVELVKAGRVSVRRELTASSAPDFYRYVWLVDGQRGASASLVRAALKDPRVLVPSFGGIAGPAELAVGYREDDS